MTVKNLGKHLFFCYNLRVTNKYLRVTTMV